jgi:hypothetical protein
VFPYHAILPGRRETGKETEPFILWLKPRGFLAHFCNVVDSSHSTLVVCFALTVLCLYAWQFRLLGSCHRMVGVSGRKTKALLANLDQRVAYRRRARQHHR